KKPVALIIMDGFGYTKESKGNAILAANTPNLDRICKKYPNTLMKASGLDVGLPPGQMGNSEVGHTNIGAGRIVYQDLTRITKSIEEGDFFKNEVLCQAMDNAKNSALHLMGLLSDGGVHSHIDHLKALVKMAKEKGVEKVYVHAFTDGRDTDPQSGLEYVKEAQVVMDTVGIGEFATVSGRYYAMDRDKRWERVELAYKAMAKGEGETATSVIEAIEKSYADGKNDEFVLPTVIVKDGNPVGTIKANNSVVFFNFR
ncbi:MAG: 2,3-bisphosphoglycerate-independent phosphoglycerate mutase, partial [Peptostreptococcaceae bacterium]